MTDRQNKAYNFLLKNNFSPINQESYPFLRDYDRNDNTLSELIATVAVIWAPQYNALWAVIESYLCTVWFPPHDLPVYFEISRPPSESALPEEIPPLRPVIDALYSLSFEAGLPCLRVFGVEECFLKEYTGIPGYHIKTEYSDDRSEYVYQAVDFLDLKGGINELKRRHIKKCQNKAADIEFYPVSAGNIQLCFEIQEEWCGMQDCDKCKSFVGCEKEVLQMMAVIFDKNIHQGLLMNYQQKPVGYAIWEKKNDKFVFMYLAKANLSDMNVYLYHEIVKNYLSDKDCLNVSEDIGKPGLRMFKSHLGIYQLKRKYLCEFVKKEGV